MSDPRPPGAVAHLQALETGVGTAEDYARDCRECCALWEPVLRAWTVLDPDCWRPALPGGDQGPLYGLPVGVKDLIDTVDAPTAYGSPIYCGHRPQRDAWIVTRLKSLGAALPGKTVTTEFACFPPGPTRNPHDPALSPGGSSSGSAAAVAAGMVPLALGTQTAGSIIRPAAYCGIFGFKPTHGKLPMTGIKPLSPSLDTLGVFARTLADIAFLTEHLVPSQRASSRLPNRPRIAVCPPLSVADGDPDPARDRRRIAAALASARCIVETLDAQVEVEALSQAQETVMAVEAASSLAAEADVHWLDLAPAVRLLIEQGRAAGPQALDPALRAIAAARRKILGRSDWDIVLTQSVVDRPPPATKGTGDPVACRAWTAAGFPALSIPIDRGAGLPGSVQMIGRPGGDRTLLNLADKLIDACSETGLGHAPAPPPPS
ncbi:amidase [Roseobacter sp. HKCCD9010]|uniref:amidase n=1 Tax=unclassified Roseobacter TaxID=196798 RepID=UPI0014922F10|nr:MULTISPECIES: amidase [unclassified Roseobacter]MBF9052227.1 amidase [Rhodobacterales bacterium HKCCD4356]NNV14309.1 amidase [Roseobacter sp. HKCCD7357]NNV18347.1 amidase [Roseobacter sp. HKCCD8768]NNV27942.1 amidase [Roseobacter sp. HKCCD8192]NNV32121.1 amidase [Roseobacter sp. HKCCD9061]